MTVSKRLPGLVLTVLSLLGHPALAADTSCGGQSCEESVCSSSDVLLCSDWNNGSYDGWSFSANRYSNGGDAGDVVASKGMNGTRAVEFKIKPAYDQTIWFGTGIPATSGPLHERMMVKFSPGYQFMMVCGLQKQFYFERSNRIMVGVTKASDMGGSYAGQPNTVGVFGFDYYGHYVELPKQSGDSPTLIYPDRWYSVETMVDPSTKTVKQWIDGKLQMTRSGDSRFGDSTAVSSVQDTSWNGGDPSVCSKNTQTQYVWHDNHVIRRSYIGPIGSGGGTPPPSPTAPPAPTLLP
jgi:hypothetical protein